MKNLNLSVYERFFNAIESQAKTEEYRSMTNDYWMNKLVDLSAYPGKDLNEVRDGLYRGMLEMKPIKYDTLTFYTTRGGKRVHLIIKWRDTVVQKGYKTFSIRLGDLIEDSNGNHPKPKNR